MSGLWLVACNLIVTAGCIQHAQTQAKQASQQCGCRSEHLYAMMMQTSAVTSAALHQQEQSVPRTKLEMFQLAESSKAAFTEQDDPVNPFTLFGNTRYNAHLSTCALHPFSLSNCHHTLAGPTSLHALLALSCRTSCIEPHNQCISNLP